MAKKWNRRQFLKGSGATAVTLSLGHSLLAGNRMAQTGRFVEFLWSGAITPHSARVNAKINHDSAAVRLLVSADPTLTNPLYSGFQTAALATNNRVVSLPIDGLQPDTPYYYAIEAGGLVDTTLTGRFRTPATVPFSFTFAFAACAETGSSHPIFDTIRGHNPLFFLHMGDLHYLDIGSNSRAAFRQGYETVLAAPTQAALYRSTPLVYMWDDHDYGPNDSDATAPGREAARLTYQEYVPHYPLVAGQGNVPVYQAFTIGRVRFIVTDTRSERTPKTAVDDAGKSMMGAAQKAWFKQELLNAAAAYPVIIWVSTSPWIADPPGSGNDNWAGYTTERRELADFIAANEIQGLFMLSGDVHMVAIDDGSNNRYGTNGRRGFPVMQAAALDRSNATYLPGNTYSEGQYPGSNQFGLMTVTDDGGDQIGISWSGRTHDDREIVHLDLTVPPSPRLGVVPQRVALVAALGGPQQPQQRLTIANRNVGTFTWSIAAETAASWLTISSQTGTATVADPATVTLTADPAGLSYGLYHTTLRIDASPATGAPQFVPLTFLYTNQPSTYLPTIVHTSL